MANIFFDFDDKDVGIEISDGLAIKENGELYMRMDKHVAWNLDTGKMHLISEWSKDNRDKKDSQKRR